MIETNVSMPTTLKILEETPTNTNTTLFSAHTGLKDRSLVMMKVAAPIKLTVKIATDGRSLSTIPSTTRPNHAILEENVPRKTVPSIIPTLRKDRIKSPVSSLKVSSPSKIAALALS